MKSKTEGVLKRWKLRIQHTMQRRRESTRVKIMWLCAITALYFLGSACYNGVSIVMDLYEPTEYEFIITNDSIKSQSSLNELRNMDGIRIVTLQSEMEMVLSRREQKVSIQAVGVSGEYIGYKLKENESLNNTNYLILAADNTTYNQMCDELYIVKQEEKCILQGEGIPGISGQNIPGQGIIQEKHITSLYQVVQTENTESLIQMNQKELEQTATKLRILFRKRKIDESDIKDIEYLGCSMIKTPDYYEKTMKQRVKWTQIRYQIIIGILCLLFLKGKNTCPFTGV